MDFKDILQWGTVEGLSLSNNLVTKRFVIWFSWLLNPKMIRQFLS